MEHQVHCGGGGGARTAAPAQMAPGWVSEELQASFETMQLALAPEKALQVAAAVAAVATAVATAEATAQAQGAVEKVGVSQGRKQF